MALFFDKIINSAKLAWKGEERLWKAFWLWGILPYIVVILLAALTSWIFYEIKPSLRIFSILKLEDFVLFLYSIIIVYVAPISILVIASRNAKNISFSDSFLRRICIFFALMLTPMFFSIIHLIALSVTVGVGLTWGSGGSDSIIMYFTLLLIFLTVYLNYRFYKNYKKQSLII